MKKLLIATAITFMTLTPAFCADAVFDSYEAPVQKIDIEPVSSAKPVAKSATKQAVGTSADKAEVQNANYEQAITSLDAAQAEVREEYITYTQKYNEAKARYDAVSAECKEYKKYMKEAEKKIENLEKTKKNIGKNII